MDRFFNESGDNAPRMIIAINAKLLPEGEDWLRYYMVSRCRDWEVPLRPHGYNAGDCCWWTGLAAITYPDDPEFLEGVKCLSPIYDEEWERHPFGELQGTVEAVDGFTRDQFVSAITALATLDYDSAIEAIDKTNMFRLSKSTFGRPELWFWIQAIKHKGDFWGKVWAKLFGTTVFIQKLFAYPLDLMARDMAGWKGRQVHPNDLTKEAKMSKLVTILNKIIRPKAYSNHLDALKLYTIRELGISRLPLASRMVRRVAGKFNYLIRLLTGEKINKSLIKDYESRHGWTWQGYLDHTKFVNPKCTEEEAKYNAMDKDLLWKLWDGLN